jgi:hypothetical protein
MVGVPNFISLGDGVGVTFTADIMVGDVVSVGVIDGLETVERSEVSLTVHSFVLKGVIIGVSDDTWAQLANKVNNVNHKGKMIFFMAHLLFLSFVN